VSRIDSGIKDQIILDTNLLLFAFVDVEKMWSSKVTVREKIYSCVAKYFIRESPIKLLLPNFILDIELPRILSKLIIQKNITDETKLKVLVNMSKQFRQFTQYLRVLEKCREIDVWKTVYFKKAAGLYIALSQKLGRDKVKGNHQDILIMAVTMVENATLITGDRGVYNFAREADINVRMIYVSSQRKIYSYKADPQIVDRIEKQIKDIG